MAGKVQNKKTQSKPIQKKVQSKNAQNKKDYNDVWVIAEQLEGVVNEVTVELLGEGRKLADKLKKKLVVVIAGNEIQDVVDRLMHYGVDSAIYIEHPLLKEYTTDGYAKVITDAVNEYKPEALDHITKGSDFETVIREHTMFPAYTRFLPKERRNAALHSLLICDGNYYNLIVNQNLRRKRFLRYCPVCTREDRERLGETYWHREHQIIHVDICHLFILLFHNF